MNALSVAAHIALIGFCVAVIALCAVEIERLWRQGR